MPEQNDGVVSPIFDEREVEAFESIRSTPQQVNAPPPPTPPPGTQMKVSYTVPASVGTQQRQYFRPPSSQNRFHVPQGRDINTGKWLDDNHDNPAYSDHYLTVYRKGPAGLAGTILNADKHIPLMPLGELVHTVQEYAGGGSFRYTINTADHRGELTGNFTIPVNDYPAKRPDGSDGFGESKPTEAPEIVEKKKEIELLKLEQQKEALTRREEREAERKREADMSEAAEMRKEMMQFVKESREETRRIMEESKKETRDLTLQMMTMMKEMIGATKKGDDSGSNVVAEAVKAQGEFLANSIKTQSEQSSKFMEMMINMNKGSKEETAAAAKAQAEQQTKMVEMVVNNVKAMADVGKSSGESMQKLFMELLGKQINHNPMKEVLDLMQRGKDDAFEMMEVMNANKPVVDPEADPTTGIINALINRFAGGGGGAAVSAAPARNMTPEQINDFARSIAPVVQAHMNQPPQQSLPAPQMSAENPPPPSQHGPRHLQPSASDLFEGGDLDESDYPTMDSPQMSPPPQQQSQSQPQPQQTSIPQTREEAILMAGGEENFNKYVCTQIIQMATKDAETKSPRASWVEPALTWLTDSVQKAIAEAPDVPHKALVIQQKCEVASFEKLKGVTSEESYKVFTEGLAALSETIKVRQAQGQ